mmetsp:Transcript_110130/g.298694  ORF Transcript_110130/g.298694 Transcript_110130/m.298694 type:complete len:276 (-) Transcript_110130:258-1085(-)
MGRRRLVRRLAGRGHVPLRAERPGRPGVWDEGRALYGPAHGRAVADGPAGPLRAAGLPRPRRGLHAPRVVLRDIPLPQPRRGRRPRARAGVRGDTRARAADDDGSDPRRPGRPVRDAPVARRVPRALLLQEQAAGRRQGRGAEEPDAHALRHDRQPGLHADGLEAQSSLWGAQGRARALGHRRRAPGLWNSPGVQRHHGRVRVPGRPHGLGDRDELGPGRGLPGRLQAVRRRGLHGRLGEGLGRHEDEHQHGREGAARVRRRLGRGQRLPAREDG